MDKGKNFEEGVVFDATKDGDRVICSIRILTDEDSVREILVHFSFWNETFFAAMKRAKLVGFEKTFASGFYFTGSLSEGFPKGGETDPAIWMPVETEEDTKYLFSLKPWKETDFTASLKKRIAKTIRDEFEAFQKEMLPEEESL